MPGANKWLEVLSPFTFSIWAALLNQNEHRKVYYPSLYQRGTKMHAGTNVKMGGDDTLFTTVSGIVKFERVGRSGKKVSVYPVEAAN